jgi:hypothetical protein
MNDITSVFHDALTAPFEWSEPSVLRVADAMKSAIHSSSVDWESNVENWARVLVKGREVAFISSASPLCLVESSVCDEVSDIIQENKMKMIVCEDMADEKFSISRTVLEKTFRRDLSDAVNYDRISLHDLWFVTV